MGFKDVVNLVNIIDIRFLFIDYIWNCNLDESFEGVGCDLMIYGDI